MRTRNKRLEFKFAETCLYPEDPPQGMPEVTVDLDTFSSPRTGRAGPKPPKASHEQPLRVSSPRVAIRLAEARHGRRGAIRLAEARAQPTCRNPIGRGPTRWTRRDSPVLTRRYEKTFCSFVGAERSVAPTLEFSKRLCRPPTCYKRSYYPYLTPNTVADANFESARVHSSPFVDSSLSKHLATYMVC
eukprot:7420638-Pyramimonas_sp.AAC.2